MHGQPWAGRGSGTTGSAPRTWVGVLGYEHCRLEQVQLLVRQSHVLVVLQVGPERAALLVWTAGAAVHTAIAVAVAIACCGGFAAAGLLRGSRLAGACWGGRAGWRCCFLMLVIVQVQRQNHLPASMLWVRSLKV